MRVGSDAKPMVYPRFLDSKLPAARKEKNSSVESLANSDPAGGGLDRMTGDVGHIDFTDMTRQQLFDWMNDQIRNGKMSLDESTPFLSMTVKVSAESGQIVDAATDTERVDFIDRTRRGIEGALWRHDKEDVARLRAALATMEGIQGMSGDLDLTA